MRSKKEFRAVIHIGSTAVHTVVGYFSHSNKTLKIVAVGNAPTTAFFGGKIHDREKLLQAIELSTRQAMDMAGLELYDVGLSFATAYIASANGYSKGVLTNRHNANEAGAVVTAQKVSQLLSELETDVKNLKHTLMQLQIQMMVIDPQGTDNKPYTIKNAIGLRTHELSIYYHAIGVPKPYYEQMKELFLSKQFGIYPPMFAGVSGAEYALTDEEKQNGTCFVDIGVGTTDVCVYKSGFLIFTHCIDMGGDALTREIADWLKVSYTEAETIKCQYGQADPTVCSKAHFENLRRRGNHANQHISFNSFELAALIERFYLQLFNQIHARVLEHPQLDCVIKYDVVLAGGGAKMAGLDALLRKKLNISTRQMTLNQNIAACKEHLSEDKNFLAVNTSIQNNEFYNAIGALLYQNNSQHLFDEEVRYPATATPQTGFFGRVLSLEQKVQKFKAWM